MSAPFQGERLGLARPLPGGVHVKIQTGMAHPVLLDLKFGQILFFSGGVQKLALFFRLHKATATVALFHPQLQCNFQKLLRCNHKYNLQPGYTSARCEGKIC